MRSPRLLTALALSATLFAGCSDTPAKHLQRARDLTFEKRPHEAIREYIVAAEQLERDDSPTATLERARALKGAADVYYLEVRDFPRAVEGYRLLVQRCPESPEALDGRIALAEILHTQYRDLRGAITELTAALDRNPPQGAELKYQVAKLYFELGNYQQVDLEASELAKKYETSAYVDDALFLRAQALAMVEGRKPDAFRAFEELTARFPDSELSPHALYEMGKLKAELNEPEKAIELWVSALKSHPDPKLVQGSIARVRQQIALTTPANIKDRDAIFDHGVKQAAAKVKVVPHKSSIEAVGGSAEEAARDFGD